MDENKGIVGQVIIIGVVLIAVAGGLLWLAVNGMLSFSTIPLRFSLWLGAVTALLSFLELAFVLISWMRGRTLPGWASTMGVTAFLFGVMFIILGIQGHYLLRLYERARERPQFLVDRVSRRPPREIDPADE